MGWDKAQQKHFINLTNIYRMLNISQVLFILVDLGFYQRRKQKSLFSWHFNLMGRAGPQTAEGLQGCGRGRPGQKGPRDLAVGCVSADWSVLAECWPSAGQAPSSPCGRRCHPPTGVGGHPTTPRLHRASQTGAQDVALTAPTQARPELGSCLAPGI